ncbi:MAG: low molecular weight phosphatase family protein [Pseudomonadota bacterium]
MSTSTESSPAISNDGVEKPGNSESDKPGPVSSILYLCNHNAIRSPMAEIMTRDGYGRSIYVESAGVRTGENDGFVEAVLNELGLSLDGRSPQALEDLEDTYFDLIITLSPTAHHVALKMEYIEAGEVLYWPSADPTVVQGSRDQMLAAYRDVRDRLQERIEDQLGQPIPRDI